MPEPSPFERERSRLQILPLGTRRVQQKNLAAQSAPHSAAQPNRQVVRLQRGRALPRSPLYSTARTVISNPREDWHVSWGRERPSARRGEGILASTSERE